MVMEANFLSLSSSVEKTFIEVRQAQKAAVLYQTLLPMVLEEELGRVIYLQDLLTRTQAFRKGVQYLLRGQLAMDLVPPEALTQAIREVNGYLKANYPRFEAAFHSPAFYYDNSKLMFTFKDNELIVYVRIPVVSGEHLFRVYEVLSFPIPMNMGSHAQPAHTRGGVLDQTILYPAGQRQLGRVLWSNHRDVQGSALHEEGNGQNLHSITTTKRQN